jgi:hypothetical protein
VWRSARPGTARKRVVAALHQQRKNAASVATAAGAQPTSQRQQDHCASTTQRREIQRHGNQASRTRRPTTALTPTHRRNHQQRGGVEGDAFDSSPRSAQGAQSRRIPGWQRLLLIAAARSQEPTGLPPGRSDRRTGPWPAEVFAFSTTHPDGGGTTQQLCAPAASARTHPQRSSNACRGSRRARAASGQHMRCVTPVHRLIWRMQHAAHPANAECPGTSGCAGVASTAPRCQLLRPDVQCLAMDRRSARLQSHYSGFWYHTCASCERCVVVQRLILRDFQRDHDPVTPPTPLFP